ncbi:MAG: trypsin-like peptidase domain-containing protein [Planctomycetota bacterium]|nr:trypsin-like peptidase domain-containing protein [Planctomycetota bacterium]MDA1105895.1 trypsin-like peptidase domain-containing protein [Planctomycetota bacterium]
MDNRSTLVVAAAAIATSAGAFFIAPAIADRQDAARSRRDVELAAGRLQSSGVLKSLDGELRDLAKTVEPSVVYVSAEMQVPGWRGTFGSSGSGWVWDEKGHIVTNAHVIDGASRLQVQDWRGQLFDAEVIGADLQSDVAVLRVDGGKGEWIAAKRQSAPAEQGQMCFAFGSPFDFRFSMSAGIVSGLGRVSGLPGMELENFVQVDAAINPGNSGGPLTDVEGRVIGMNTAIASGAGDQMGPGSFSGVGLAIPMDIIELVVPQLISSGEVAKGYLGVSVQPVGFIQRAQLRDPQFGDAYRHVRDDYKEADGALVNRVELHSPAATAGLQPGDVIVTFGGVEVAESAQIPALIATHRPGETIAVHVWRDGKVTPMEVTLERRSADLNVPHIARDLAATGLKECETFVEAGPSGTVRGVRASRVDANSQWSELVPADAVIVSVADSPVRNVEELYVRLARIRGQVRRFQSVPVPLGWVRPNGERGTVEVVLKPE